MHESVSPVGTVYPIICHQGFCQSAKKSSQWCNCLYSRPNTDRQTDRQRYTHKTSANLWKERTVAANAWSNTEMLTHNHSLCDNVEVVVIVHLHPVLKCPTFQGQRRRSVFIQNVYKTELEAAMRVPNSTQLPCQLNFIFFLNLAIRSDWTKYFCLLCPPISSFSTTTTGRVLPSLILIPSPGQKALKD